MKTYIGIDPGLKGGIAVIYGWQSHHGTQQNDQAVLCERMPGSPAELCAILESMRNDNTIVILEKAQAMPKQGVCAMFNYGRGYGVLLGMLTALRIPYVEVRPAEWKKEILAGVADKTDKGASILACERLFPSVDLVPKGCRKPQDGMAESLLMAEYGRRKNL